MRAAPTPEAFFPLLIIYFVINVALSESRVLYHKAGRQPYQNVVEAAKKVHKKYHYCYEREWVALDKFRWYCRACMMTCMDAGNDAVVFESSDFQSNIIERRIPSQLWLSKVLHQAVEMKPIQPSCSLFVPNISQWVVVAQLSTFPPLFFPMQ